MNKLKLLGFLSVFIISILVLVIPLGIRYAHGDPLFASGLTYYNMRASEDLSSGFVFDNLQGKPHKLSFFHYLLYPLINLLGENNLFIIPIILGVLSSVLFFLVCELFFDDERGAIIAGVAFVLSPIFIYLFTSLTPYTFATPLFLLFVYFFLIKNNLSILFLAFLSITNFSFFVLSVILVAFESFYHKSKNFFLINLIPSIVSLFIFLYFFHNFVDFELLSPSFSSFFISFGAKIGVAFFYLFLGLLGFFIISQQGRPYNYLLGSTMFVLVASLFTVGGKILLNFYLCIFTAVMILFLIKREWAIMTIKRFTLLLIFCGLIFSTALYSDQIIVSQPDNNLEKALVFLSLEPQGKVFSYQEYGYFIEYFSNKSSFLDNSFDGDLNSTLRTTENNIFYSRKLETTTTLLDENEIKYFLITPDMKTGLVWKKSEEGLLFLLKNTNSFKKIYDYGGVEIWTYPVGFQSEIRS